MKKLQNLLLSILCLLLLQVFFACSRKRKVILTGFAFHGESLEVSYKDIKLTPFDFRIDNASTRLQFFYEQRQLKGDQIKVKATIDSGGIRLLDTLLVIPDDNKVPLITFLDPATTPRRSVFLADNDSILKY
jgi:hypothetical protein